MIQLAKNPVVIAAAAKAAKYLSKPKNRRKVARAIEHPVKTAKGR